MVGLRVLLRMPFSDETGMEYESYKLSILLMNAVTGWKKNHNPSGVEQRIINSEV